MRTGATNEVSFASAHALLSQHLLKPRVTVCVRFNTRKETCAPLPDCCMMGYQVALKLSGYANAVHHIIIIINLFKRKSFIHQTNTVEEQTIQI